VGVNTFRHAFGERKRWQMPIGWASLAFAFVAVQCSASKLQAMNETISGTTVQSSQVRMKLSARSALIANGVRMKLMKVISKMKNILNK
jgi:hypothetical protein